MEFIENLIQELKKRGIKKTELARQIQIPESTIRSWEKGSQPTIDKVIKIADYLELSIDELCERNAKNNENKIQRAYNKAEPEIQIAINKLLDLKEENELTTISSISKIG